MNAIDRMQYDEQVRKMKMIAQLLNTFAETLTINSEDDVLRSNIITLMAQRLILGIQGDDEG
jgi:hypothetical protein